MKTLALVVCSAVLALSQSGAQTSSNRPTDQGSTNTTTTSSTSRTDGGSSTTSNGSNPADRNSANTTSRSITDNRGTVIDYTPGESITIEDGNSAAPVRFLIGNNVQITGPQGDTLSPSAVKKNSLVRLHFGDEGGKPVVQRIQVDNMIKQQP
jgi:hypothetical protein